MFAMESARALGRAPSFRQPSTPRTPERRKSSSDMRIEELKAMHRESSVQEIKSKFDKGKTIPETRESFQEKLRRMSQADRAMMRAIYFHSDRSKLTKTKENEKTSLADSQRLWDLDKKTAIIEEWSKSALLETGRTSLTKFDAEESLRNYGITEATTGEDHWALWQQAIDQVMQTLKEKPIEDFTTDASNLSSPIKLVEDLSTEHCKLMLRNYSPVLGISSLPGSPVKAPAPVTRSSFSYFFKSSKSDKSALSEKENTTAKSDVLEDHVDNNVDSSFDDHTEGAGVDESDNEVDGENAEEILVESYNDDVWKVRSMSGCAEREDVLNLATPDKEEADTIPSCNPSTIVSPSSSFSPLLFPRSRCGSESDAVDRHMVSRSVSPSGVGSGGSYNVISSLPASSPPSPKSPTGNRVVHVVSAEEDARLDIAVAVSEKKALQQGPQTTLLGPSPLPDTDTFLYSELSVSEESSQTAIIVPSRGIPGQRSLIWSSLVLVGCFLVLLSLTLYATLYPRSEGVSKHVVTVHLPSIPAPRARETSKELQEEVLNKVEVEEPENSFRTPVEDLGEEVRKGLILTGHKSLQPSSYDNYSIPSHCPSPIVEIKLINVCSSPSAVTLKSFRSAIGKLKSFLMSVFKTLVRPFKGN
eukprot:gene27973-33779_t